MHTSALNDLASASVRQASPPWLIVFDLDGTLIDSSRDLCTSVNAALAYVGQPSLPLAVVGSFIGDGAAALVRRALIASAKPARFADPDEENSVFSSAFNFFLASYRDHQLDTTRTYPGVIEALNEIHQRCPELLMAVLTNKPVNPSRELCSALGLSKFFFANYGGDSFATKKPAPEGLLRLMDEGRSLCSKDAQRTAAGVVMVGDSPADVLVARACGARSLGCLYGLGPEELKGARPDQVVNTASEWMSALKL